MKKLTLFLTICLEAGGGYAQVTIDSCQERARANYPLIKQYDLISKSVEYTISNANKAYLPQFSVTGIGAYIFKGLPSMTLPGSESPENEKLQFIGIGQINQTVWDGGATRSQKEIAKAAGEVEKASIDVALYQIRERVNQLYFGILLIDEHIKQLVILDEMAERNFRATSLSKESGLAYQTDIDELKAEILRLEQRKVELTFTRKGYIEMLSYMMGQQLTEDAKLQLPVVDDSITLRPLIRPELMLYTNQRRLIDAQGSVHRIHNMPKVGLLAAGVLVEPGMAFGPSTLNSLAIGGLSVSWNTGGLYKTSNSKQLDKISLDKIVSQEETFRFTTNLQLRQAGTDIEKQKSILGKDQEIVILKEKIRKAYQLKYENGLCPMNELIRSMNQESEARSQQALHQVQLVMSLYTYQTISGY